VEIPAIELASAVVALHRIRRFPARSGQPVLDPAAIRRYRQRLTELRVEIEESRGLRVLAELGELPGQDRLRVVIDRYVDSGHRVGNVVDD
jgi:hypothetical protein